MNKSFEYIKRFLNILLVLTLLFSLSACAADKRNSQAFQEIKSKGILRIGVYGNVPGFSELTDEGFIGFEAELATIVGEYVTQGKYVVELVEVTELSRTHSLIDNKVDLCVSQFMSTVSKSTYALSKPYFLDTYAFLIKEGSYTSVQDLAGKRVGAIYGQGVKSVVKNFSDIDSLNFEIVDVASYPQAGDMLLSGSLDALCAQQALLQKYAQDGLQMLPTGFGEAFYCIAAHGSKKELAQLADEKLKEMEKDGSLYALAVKYGLQ